jgi:hypothetical protein
LGKVGGDVRGDLEEVDEDEVVDEFDEVDEVDEEVDVER